MIDTLVVLQFEISVKACLVCVAGEMLILYELVA